MSLALKPYELFNLWAKNRPQMLVQRAKKVKDVNYSRNSKGNR